jgi:hypothetical protein
MHGARELLLVQDVYSGVPGLWNLEKEILRRTRKWLGEHCCHDGVLVAISMVTGQIPGSGQSTRTR